MTDLPMAAPFEAVNLTYSAGGAVALVAPGCALVFAETPSGEAVARCWPLVRDRAGVAAIVEALLSEALRSEALRSGALLSGPLRSGALQPGSLPSGSLPRAASPVQRGLDSLPGFALVCADEAGANVVLRSPGQALVTLGDGAAHRLTADRLATWAELRLGTEASAVTIGVDDDLAARSLAPAGYPLVGGTVLAGSVTLYLGSIVAPQPAAPILTQAPASPPPASPPPASPLPASPPPASTTSVGVIVQSVACPYGHLGPPYEPYCRICGTAIEDPRPFLAERPPLGLLRLSTGDVVPLDRGVIMGRNPRTADEHDAGRPHLVRLPSPDNDVSRTHVEVRLEDWHVLVVDLGSTNGTTVTIPGQAPIRLRAHEPMPLEPNAEVNLADEIVFRYEVPTG